MASIEHYENFPVASWACPPALRPAVLAIYRFARTADDLADEGPQPPAARLDALAAYRRALEAAVAGRPPREAWPEVFGPLAAALRAEALPPPLLHALLDAFVQDVHNPPYPDRAALLAYCARSADPIGRLLLHLARVGDPLSLQQSDAICSALQLINFWQDLSVDLARHRLYVPAADLARHGLDAAALQPGRDSPASRALVAELCSWAGALMASGAPLALRLPGRFGWELRLVVQGGLRILEKIRAMDHASLSRRPTLKRSDTPVLLWRALRMGPR
ncbi:MAG TPA: squalene synthase HpnC [Rubrivivax sp.]|nr:squalene synthase HpnC [Rubrivivax sp.]